MSEIAAATTGAPSMSAPLTDAIVSHAEHDATAAEREAAPVESDASAQPSAEGDALEAPAEPKPAEDKFTLKVNGEERSFTREETTKLAQRGLAADKRFQEASAKEKRIEAMFAGIDRDPIGTLERIVGTKRLEAEIDARVRARVEWETMTAEERARAELDRDRREFESQQAAAQRQEFDRRVAAEAPKHEAALHAHFTDALGRAGLRASNANLAMLATLVHQAIQRGEQPDVDAYSIMIRENYQDAPASHANAPAPAAPPPGNTPPTKAPTLGNGKQPAKQVARASAPKPKQHWIGMDEFREHLEKTR